MRHEKILMPLIELGKAYPAEVLNKQVVVSFTDISVVDGVVTGTVVNQSTGTTYNFLGADVNKDSVVSFDEITFTITEYGIKVFLPIVQR